LNFDFLLLISFHLAFPPPKKAGIALHQSHGYTSTLQGNLKTDKMSTVTNSQGITPFLWFDGKAEEAMKLYTSIFPNSSITTLKKWGEGSPFPADWVMGGTIIIDGLRVNLFDAGPQFKFNESVSFFVSCKNQEEVDRYWAQLTADGGEESMCGWLKDKFGLSWQIVPSFLMEKLSGGEPKRVGQMMQALGQMRKLNIAELEQAYNR
jgi:predicted 3-demethylubiquinone-9 3-methyltransferase (glyoxalase superfamily)